MRLVIKSLTSSLLFLSITATAAPTKEQLLAQVKKENELIYRYETEERFYLEKYLSRRGLIHGPNEDFDIQIDHKPIPMRPYSIAEMQRDAATQALVKEYYGHQGIHRYNGIFVESGAAWTGSYQWDTLANAGFDNKALRDSFLDKAVENKIFNIRIGQNFHKLDPRKPSTLKDILDFHREAWARGISITDSVLFFSGLQKMETFGPDGKVDPYKSYQNNPKYPDYVESIANLLMPALFKEADKFNKANEKLPVSQRKPMARIAVNPVNEPETNAGFNFFWNGGHDKWGDANRMRLYVPTIIADARASVRIRLATERAAQGKRVLYFHNEAMTTATYPTHEGDLQFAVSKFMLGDDQLMKANFEALMTESLDSIRERYYKNKAKGDINVVEASIIRFVDIPWHKENGTQEKAREFIVEQLKALQNEHLNLIRETRKTAKTDTILMLDYYQQSEFKFPKTVPQLIKDLSANGGEKLKAALKIADDFGFLKVLEYHARRAEAATGQSIWKDYQSVDQIDLEKFLSLEDAIVMDKLMGLRNEWSFREEALFKSRRDRAGFDYAALHTTDEKRIDFFLDKLLADNAKVLKAALEVKNNKELMEVLKVTGLDTSDKGASVKVKVSGTLREALNASERTILHRLFGLKRERATGFLPPHYARQQRAGMRKGFYETFTNYVNELGIRIGGIGESGTPYYPWATVVQQQMMLELAAAAKNANFMIVRHDIGPAVGTIGWMSGPMTGDMKTNGRRGEDGIFKLVEVSPGKFVYQLSAWRDSDPWYQVYRNTFESFLTRAQNNLSKPWQQISPHPLNMDQLLERSKSQWRMKIQRAGTCEALFTR